jgi:hypothetical protein
MIDLKPIGKPRTVGEVDIQYVGSSKHSHEGGHEIALDAHTLLVLPDGRTTARQRSHALSEALQAVSIPEASLLDTVIGRLVRVGATNLILDGEPLIVSDPPPVLSIRLDITPTDSGLDFDITHLRDGR